MAALTWRITSSACSLISSASSSSMRVRAAESTRVSGEMTPSSGSVTRSSASNPVTTPVATDTIGWYSTRISRSSSSSRTRRRSSAQRGGPWLSDVRLAARIAASAWRITASTSSSRPATAAPALTFTCSSWSPTRIGWRMRAVNRSETACARAGSPSPVGKATRNSSPPNRPEIMPPSCIPRMRAPTSRSTWSASRCPRRVLMVLKWSRSRNSTATRCPGSQVAASSRRSSRNRGTLARPVSASVDVCCWSTASRRAAVREASAIAISACTTSRSASAKGGRRHDRYAVSCRSPDGSITLSR